MTAVRHTDVVVIGSGFGGAIPAYHLAAGGAKVTILERGPWLSNEQLVQDYKLGTWTRIIDFVVGDGLSLMTGNCVGGGSVVYFAASLRAPSFVFERHGSVGRRIWPRAISRATLDPWYDRVEEALPIVPFGWNDVSYAGGLFAAACDHAGRTCNPTPQAVDLATCTGCNFMLSGCRFGAKRSMLLNYLPAAMAHGAKIRPLHEVQAIARNPGGGYRVHYRVVDPTDYRVYHEAGAIDAKIVVVAAGAVGTPVILQRSAPLLGHLPAAVGRNFSPNGERIFTAVADEAKVRDVLGLSRTKDIAYEGFAIGRSCSTANWDMLDKNLPEFDRYSLEQLFFPPGLGNVLAQAPGATGPTWFGLQKKELRRRWRSWLTIFSMGEDDNEGVFGRPPQSGAVNRIAEQMLAQGTFSYHPSANTRHAWNRATSDLTSILELDGVMQVEPWTTDVVGAVTVHPLASCRIGDHPRLSALNHKHELRGHPGIFVTDGSAVPTSLCLNPSSTIAALAERAVPGIVHRARSRGVRVRYGAPSPEGGTSGRRGVRSVVKELVG
jgi:choline dehydrogenase-like flavoprotein